jgi:hypothetical protein
MNYNRFMGNTRTFEGEGGAGGGQQQQQQKPEPKGLDRFATIWDQPKPQTPPGGGNNQQPGGGNGQQPGGGNGQNGNVDYFARQNYFQNQEITQQMEKAFNDRDFGSFQKAMGEWMRGIHQQLGAEMNTFGKHYYEKAVKDATGAATNSYRVDQVYEQAYAKHPELKLPAVNKVAKEVIANAIRNGKSVDEAITTAHDYFKEVGTAFNKPPANPSGRGIIPGGGDGDQPVLNVDELFGASSPT